MRDIVSANPGEDLGLYDTETNRAGNLLSIQVGSLEYAQDFGIDLAYFLNESYSFQNESFRSYLIETMANRGINVVSMTEVINTLFTQLNIEVGANQTNTSLIAR